MSMTGIFSSLPAQQLFVSYIKWKMVIETNPGKNPSLTDMQLHLRI